MVILKRREYLGLRATEMKTVKNDIGDWREILTAARQTHPERLELLRPHAEASLRNERYLPWDKFRYRQGALDPSSNEVKWLWALVKELRTLQGQPLLHIENYPQTLWYVPTMQIQRLCHLLDRQATTEAFYGHFPNLAQASSVQATHQLMSFVFEEAIQGGQLEGASTTRVVAQEMLSEQRPPRDQSERMILGNYKMIQRIQDVRGEELSVDMILDIHRVGTEAIDDKSYQPGALRTTDDVHVMDGDRLVHLPPSNEGLRARLEAICAWYNTPVSDFTHPLIRAIALHFLIAHEHPLYDGNGRTARALFYWAALREGYAPLRFISISAALRKAPKRYSQSFEAVQQDEFDLTYFITAQLQTIYEQFQRFKAFMESYRDALNALKERWERSRDYQDLPVRRQNILQLYLSGIASSWNAKQMAKEMHVTQTTALRDLRHLESLGFLSSEKKGRTWWFKIPTREHFKPSD